MKTSELNNYIDLSQKYLDSHFDNQIIINFLNDHDEFTKQLTKEEIKKQKVYFNYLVCNFLYRNIDNDKEYETSFNDIFNRIKEINEISNYSSKLAFLFLKKSNYISNQIYNKCIKNLLDFFHEKNIINLFFESKVWNYEDFYNFFNQTNKNSLLNIIVEFFKNDKNFTRSEEFESFTCSFLFQIKAFNTIEKILEILKDKVENSHYSDKQKRRINDKIEEINEELENNEEYIASLKKDNIDLKEDQIIIVSNEDINQVQLESEKVIDSKHINKEIDSKVDILEDNSFMTKSEDDKKISFCNEIKIEHIQKDSKTVVINYSNINPMPLPIKLVADFKDTHTVEVTFKKTFKDYISTFVNDKLINLYKFIELINLNNKKIASEQKTTRFKWQPIDAELLKNTLNNLLENLNYCLNQISKNILLNNLVQEESFKSIIGNDFIASIKTINNNINNDDYKPLIYMFVPQFENIIVDFINKHDLKKNNSNNDNVDKDAILKMKDNINKVKDYLTSNDQQDKCISLDCLFFFLYDINGFNIRNKYIHNSLYQCNLNLDIEEKQIGKLVTILLIYLLYFMQEELGH